MGKSKRKNRKMEDDSFSDDHGTVSGLNREALVFPGILLLAVVARLWTLSREHAWFDEIATVAFLNQSTLSAFLTEMQLNNPPVQPLYPILEYYWAQVFGQSDWALRLFSLVPMLFTLYLVQLIAERVSSRRAGWIATFILATSHTHIYYSQEIRMYALVLACSVASIYSLIRIVDTGERRWWVMNVALTVVLVWTHILSVFFLVGGFIYIALSFKDTRLKSLGIWIGLQAIAVMSILPWILSADFGVIRDEYVFREMPTILYRGWGIHNLSIQGLYHEWMVPPVAVDLNLVLASLQRWSQWPLVLTFGYAFGFVIYRVFQRPAKEEAESRATRRGLGLLLMISTIPVGMLYLVSADWEPSFFPRYVLISLVGMALVAGVALDAFELSRIRNGIIGIVVAVSLIQLGFYLELPARRPWSDVAERVSTHTEETVRVHLYGGDPHIMETEVRYHFNDEDAEIFSYPDLFALDEALLVQYQGHTKADAERADVVIAFTPESAGHLYAYFNAKEVDYSVQFFRTRMPLYYIRLGTAD